MPLTREAVVREVAAVGSGMRVDVLLLAASIVSVGYWACMVWEKDVKIRQQELYAKTIVDLISTYSRSGTGRPRVTRQAAAAAAATGGAAGAL